MKKIIILTTVALLIFAGTSFAETSGPSQTIKAGSTLIGKLSTNVSAGWLTSTTAYALTTFHSSGSQMYGTAHDSTSLFRKEATALAAPGASDSSAFTDGSWTTL